MNSVIITNKYLWPYRLLCYILIGLLCSTGCQDKELGPVGGGGLAPGPVSNVVAEALPGAVKLTYRLPNDKNLLYVKAVVEVNGLKRESRSSFYENSLEIKGFGDSKEYEVALYAVSRDEIASEPVYIKVIPQTSPVQVAFSSLELSEDFGGATVGFKNPSEGDLNIVLLTTDSVGDWVTADIYYTKRPEGYFSVRGYEAESRKFGVYIKDRWNNYSDTLERELVPLFEKQLDRTKFSEYRLPTDEESAWGWTMPHIWDGVIVNNTNVDKPGFHTAPGRWPQHFTFSLGVEAKLSRFRFWQRGSWIAFTDRNIKKFEVWGSNDPASDGSYDGWTLLLEGESVKPSGLPMGQNSDEDLALVGAGEEFVFPAGTPAVKYIRIKVLETWSGADSFYIMQVAFWGSDEEG